MGVKEFVDSHPFIKRALTVAAIFGLGVAVGRYTLPAKIVVKTETKEVIKEVIKEVVKKGVSKQNNKEYIKIETIMPDGTRRIETRIIDKGTVTVDLSKNTDTNTDTSKNTTSETVTEYAKNDWHGAVLVSPSSDGKLFNGGFAAGLSVERRIIGPFYLGVFGMSNKVVGVSVGVSL